MRPFALFLLIVSACTAAEFRLGIVGTDTSHVIAFVKVLNDPNNKDHIPGARIVAAYKGGSPDVESSRSRVEGYAKQLQEQWNVEIVPDIATLCSKVDGVLLESVDGRTHLPQAREIIKARKPMFIDKPLASTLEDAREIAKLAKEAGVPWFTTSSLRYAEVVKQAKQVPDSTGVTVWGPGPTEPHHYLDLAWYAIHPTEMLFTIMGTGCEEVTRVSSTREPGVDLVTCRWKDGRIGSMWAARPYGPYGAMVLKAKDTVQFPNDKGSYYVALLRDVMKFFETKVPPVPNEESLEIFAFMDAAQRSKEAGGKPVKLR